MRLNIILIKINTKNGRWLIISVGVNIFSDEEAISIHPVQVQYMYTVYIYMHRQ